MGAAKVFAGWSPGIFTFSFRTPSWRIERTDAAPVEEPV
jgi:hypothetical protein